MKFVHFLHIYYKVYLMIPNEFSISHTYKRTKYLQLFYNQTFILSISLFVSYCLVCEPTLLDDNHKKLDLDFVGIEKVKPLLIIEDSYLKTDS